MTSPQSAPARLRALIAEDRCAMAPGVFDCVSARVVEQAGFEAAYLTGHGVSNSAIGETDIGLMSFGELARQADAVIGSTSVPVIVDGDTGYGGPLNVQRTVRQLERLGAAAVQLEDQQWPKKCGHMPGKQVVPADEMVQKLHAATDARESGLVIIARTDALAVTGLGDAVERARRYSEAGADVVFIDALGDRDECRKALSRLDGPVMANMVEGSRTFYGSAEELHDLGFALAIWPLSLMMASVAAMREAAESLRTGHRIPADRLTGTRLFPEFLGDFWRFGEVTEREQRYAVREA